MTVLAWEIVSMATKNLILARRAYIDIIAGLPLMVAGMEALDDPVERKAQIAYLALVDQRLARARDFLIQNGCSDLPILC